MESKEEFYIKNILIPKLKSITSKYLKDHPYNENKKLKFTIEDYDGDTKKLKNLLEEEPYNFEVGVSRFGGINDNWRVIIVWKKNKFNK